MKTDDSEGNEKPRISPMTRMIDAPIRAIRVIRGFSL